jgi:hypothetical protein
MPASQALLSHAHPAHDEQPPLADGPSAIRLLTVPEIGPPFDDAMPGKAVAGTAAWAAGAGAEPVDPGAGRAGSTPTGAAPCAVDSAGTRADCDPGAEWAPRFARLLTEALAGARPARQILPWTSDRARVQFRALTPLFGGGQRPRVLRVIATTPAPDVIEMTVVAVLGARTRALAVRLERAEANGRPAWLNPPARRKQPQPSALAVPAARRAKATATAPRWLCTEIEAA